MNDIGQIFSECGAIFRGVGMLTRSVHAPIAKRLMITRIVPDGPGYQLNTFGRARCGDKNPARDHPRYHLRIARGRRCRALGALGLSEGGRVTRHRWSFLYRPYSDSGAHYRRACDVRGKHGDES